MNATESPNTMVIDLFGEESVIVIFAFGGGVLV
jgi:hypothetical protein